MFSSDKEPGERISGTVERFGGFMDGGGAFMTYEVHLEGQPVPFCVGAPPRRRPVSLVHLTQVGDHIEFEALSRRLNEDFRRALEASFKNHTLTAATANRRQR